MILVEDEDDDSVLAVFVAAAAAAAAEVDSVADEVVDLDRRSTSYGDKSSNES